LLAALLCCGCGTTLARKATEQMLTSDAVDRTIARFDFSVLAGEKVFLDTRYIQNVKDVGFVNADYIISSLRQQMIAAHCLLQERQGDADYVVEARVGALGSDRHEVVYGMPANNALNAATSMMPTLPSLPTIPEIAIAKKNDELGAAKIAVFAYQRESGYPVWQSGVATSRSTAKQTWVFGAGPFQQGTIYDGPQFAGSRLRPPLLAKNKSKQAEPEAAPAISYREQYRFPKPESQDQEAESESEAVHASGESEASADSAAGTNAEAETSPEPAPAAAPESAAAQPTGEAASAPPAQAPAAGDSADRNVEPETEAEDREVPSGTVRIQDFSAPNLLPYHWLRDRRLHAFDDDHSELVPDSKRDPVWLPAATHRP
jgi:hypothetical protein